MPRKTRKRRTHRTSPEDPAQLLQLAALGCKTICYRIAGRCASETASLLKDWRDEKRYKAYCSRWSEFCVLYLNITRSEADKLIRMWEQYGDAFFRLAAVTRITAFTFRFIAPAVKDGVLHFRSRLSPCSLNMPKKSAGRSPFCGVAFRAGNAPRPAQNRETQICQLRHEDPASPLNLLICQHL
jgi:hypothetical protein